MSNNISETLDRWSNDAASERNTWHAYVGLKPVKKEPSYRLLLDPVPGFDENLQKISNVFNNAVQQRTLKPSAGYTVHVPAGRQLSTTNPQMPSKFATEEFSVGNLIYDQYGDGVLVLTVNARGDLIGYVASSLSQKKIPLILIIEDSAVKNQIADAIRNRKTLTSQQYTVVAAALAKHGYLIHANGVFAKLQTLGEKQSFLGKPIFARDEVNFLDGYLSWYDFFNDLKAAVVKPLTVLLLGVQHAFIAVFRFPSGINRVMTGQPGAVTQFDLAVQSFLRAVIYGVMTRYLMVLVAQLLSMMMRLIMTVPSLFSTIPGVINACTEQGVLRVAGRGLYGFGAGFFGMFSSAASEPRVEEVMFNPTVRPTVSQSLSKEERRKLYNKRYPLQADAIPGEKESNSLNGDPLGCGC